MPRAGESFLGFALVEELGRGAFARVFLARQESLANRFVALKVTRRPTREAEKLARLQHTNVVPVYSVHDAWPVQLICMPFLGRRTIADALRSYHQEHPSRASSSRRSSRTRKDGTSSLSGSGSGSSAGRWSGTRPTPRANIFPDGPPLIGDVNAVLRTLAAIADGLAHAHARNILHLDIKPANVLLADTGEPMLLDFNLSFDTTAPDREMIGGTVQYMAPEQLIDVRSGGKGGVDARTDLYSLGVLAYEMLTGSVPFPAPSQKLNDFDALIAARRDPLPSARKKNPNVTPAVEAILRKLLAPNPEHRYQSADQLRTDLECQLNHQPLKFAPDRSVRERFRKWRRRNPGLFVRFVAAALIGLALGAGVAAERQSAARTEAEAVARASTTHAGLQSVRLDLILPDDPTARARGKERAVELLRAYGLPDDPEWRKREAFARVPVAEQGGLSADLGELLLLLAQARWHDGKFRPEPQRREIAADALRLTRLARDCFPEDAVPHALIRQHAELIAVAEPNEIAVEIEAGNAPRTPRDYFLDAALLIASGRYSAAIPLLERAIAAQPNHAAAQFCLAYCRQNLGQHARALERYEVARVLMPTDPRPAYYRGLILGTERKPALAEAEFTRAIELDPTFAEAYRNRAVARIGQGKFREAEQDLTESLTRGSSPFPIRSLRAFARKSLGDKRGAEADEKALRDARPERDTDYIVRGWTRMKDNPNAALADFRMAAEMNPRSLAALEKQMCVLADHLHDNAGALVVANRLVELYPEYARARAGRAVILARLGRRAEAHRDAAQARLLSDDPAISFLLACVYAQTSTTHPNDAKQAMTYLRQGFRDGYRDIKAFEKDTDLAPLRKSREFDDFLRAAREVTK